MTKPGLECRELLVDWPTDGLPVGEHVTNPHLWVDAAGHAVLAFRRLAQAAAGAGYFDIVVGPADGALSFAMQRAALPGEGCEAHLDSFNEGRFAIGIRGDGTVIPTSEALQDALIWGELGDLNPKLAPILNDDQATWEWTVGADRFLNFRGFASVTHALHPSNFSEETAIWPTAADPDQLPGEIMRRIVGGATFFEVGTSLMMGIMVHDDVNGVRPFVRYYGDASQGAGNLGTDGIDMVWTHGTDNDQSMGYYLSRDVMTAPYTTDPVALKPRRVRSDPAITLGAYPFEVGCGYAGHASSDSNEAFLVRLRDGVSWTLPREQGKPAGWRWSTILGITCDEAFFLVSNPTTTIARVKLSSLGEGTAPD